MQVNIWVKVGKLDNLVAFPRGLPPINLVIQWRVQRYGLGISLTENTKLKDDFVLYFLLKELFFHPLKELINFAKPYMGFFNLYNLYMTNILSQINLCCWRLSWALGFMAFTHRHQ